MDKKTIIDECNCGITNLKRSIAYASNLPNKEAKEALEEALEGARLSVWRAINALNDLEDPYANQSIASFTIEKDF